MAWVIIGGLTSSLFLTLLVVPCIYYIVDKLMARFSRQKANKTEQGILQVENAVD